MSHHVEQYELLNQTAQGAGAVNGSAENVNEDHCVAFLNCSALTGTGPSLNVDIESLDPISQQWFTVASFTALNAPGSERIDLGVLPDQILRATGTVAGTGPAATYTVSLLAKEL